MSELPKTFDPQAEESRWYDHWQGKGYFQPAVEPDKPRFSITIPPPNVTGELHMGHALQHTIHDVILRRKRMQGFNTLCVPGTDHAGIATQMKVDQALRREGLDRREMGRDAFLERAREWTQKYGGTILGQLRALGCSYDWSRTRFTLDEFVSDGPDTADWALGLLYQRSGYARAVLTAFEHCYNRGWIYRGKRIVNWCPTCQTVVSDLEVQHRDLASHLWHIRYPSADGSEGITVATTRPETMLGDTGVAVSPSDARYARLIDKQVMLPLMDRAIPVVADAHVDPQFGTGAVKVTPAHDPNDWDIAQRHPELLPAVEVIGDDGVMTADAGAYGGLRRDEARKQVVAALEEQGLLVKTEEYTHSVGHHDKCGAVIEPLLKWQWFMRMRDLADGALAAVRAGRVKFVPERFTQPQIDWLENIRDWCVSRQLWWGHRIPLYYCMSCDPGVVGSGDPPQLVEVLGNAQPIASVEPVGECPRCGATVIAQDPDVLDTWFSSALWPHGTLGWPEQTGDLGYYYPTDLMITGRDILYLWVARMIMTGEEFIQAEPFREVLVHATVMTAEGKRMSKSLGTGVDPMDLIRVYGADATRFGLTSLVSESQDIRFKIDWECENCSRELKESEFLGRDTCPGCKQPLETRVRRAEQVEQARNFCTKIWNITRLLLMNLEGTDARPRPLAELKGENLALADRWILSRFNEAAAAVNGALDRYALGEAAWTLYHFLWDEVADWYVELAKPRFRNPGEAIDARVVLVSVLEAALRLAHPFVPFLTESLWQALPGAGESICVAGYPQADDSLRDADAEARMNAMMEVTRAVRNLRAEINLPAGRKVEVLVHGSGRLDEEALAYVGQTPNTWATLTAVSDAPAGEAIHASAAGMDLALPVEGLVDVAAECQRAEKELATVVRDLERVSGRLSNEQFIARAPAAVVEKERGAQSELQARREKLEERLRLFAQG